MMSKQRRIDEQEENLLREIRLAFAAMRKILAESESMPASVPAPTQPVYTPSVYTPTVYTPVPKTKVYFAFPEGNPRYTFIDEMRAEFGAEDLDAGSGKIQQPAVIFYLVAFTPRAGAEIPRRVEPYKLRCENIVLIRIHPDGDGLRATDDYWLPSAVNGERVTIALGFTTRRYDTGLTVTTTHIIQDKSEIYGKIKSVIAMVK